MHSSKLNHGATINTDWIWLKTVNSCERSLTVDCATKLTCLTAEQITVVSGLQCVKAAGLEVVNTGDGESHLFSQHSPNTLPPYLFPVFKIFSMPVSNSTNTEQNVLHKHLPYTFSPMRENLGCTCVTLWHSLACFNWQELRLWFCVIWMLSLPCPVIRAQCMPPSIACAQMCKV